MKKILTLLLMISAVSMMAKDYVTPQMYGAKADGVTDDTKAIQAALDASNKVFFPAGTYITTQSLIVHSNTTVWGKGKKSKIVNIVKSGFGKNVLVCGVIDSGDLPGSPNKLPHYEGMICADRKSFQTQAGDKFKEGDLVLISCGRVRTKNPIYCFVSKITHVDGNRYLLADSIANSYVKDQVNLRNLTNYPEVKSELKMNAYVAENIDVHDLWIEQKINEGSGMYTIFASCYNSRFHNLWLKGNTCIGSNLTAMTTVDHIYASFDGGFCDMPEYNIMSTISHVYGKRFGRRMNQIGLTVYQGYGCIIENCCIDFDGLGKVGFAEQVDPIVRNNVFYNLGSSSGCLECSAFGGSVIQDNYISCDGDYFVMTLFYSNNDVSGNQIHSKKEKWYRGIDEKKNKVVDNTTGEKITSKILKKNAKKLSKYFK